MVKIVYVGAVQLSAVGLTALIDKGIKPDLVCTLHRHLAHRHSDFDDLEPITSKHNIPLLRVDNINAPESLAAIKALSPDYLLIIGWSQLLKGELLKIPLKSTVGFHFAYLPRNRGRAAIPWAILNQEREAGVSLLHIDEGVDSGDLITQEKYEVATDETAETLYAKVCDGLCLMMSQVADWLHQGQDLPALPQDHRTATYLAKRTAEDGWIEWNKSAEDIDRLIRASGRPYPGAFTVHRNQKLIIWKSRLRPTCNQVGTVGQVLSLNDDTSVTIQCGSGWIDLLEVESEDGNRVLPATYFRRPHDRLGLDLFQLWTAQRELVARLDALERDSSE